MANYDVRINFRTTGENRGTLQQLADLAGHNNISRTVRELVDTHCAQHRPSQARRKRGARR